MSKLALSVLVGTLFFGSFTPILAAESTPIVGGAVLSLTGAGASYGEWMKGGIDLAVEEINKDGGIDGHPLEIIYQDHMADAAKAVNSFNYLVDIKHVPFSFISYSAPTLAVQPIAAQHKVVLINGGGQSNKLSNKPYLYNNINSIKTEQTIEINWIYNDLGFHTASMLTANDEAGRDASEVFRKEFTKLGGKIFGEEYGSLNATDFRAQLTKLRAEKAAVLNIGLYGRATSVAVNQARQLGIKTPMMTSAASLIPETFAAKGAQGMYVTNFSFDPNGEFAKRYEAKYHREASFYALQYYNGMHIVAQAAKKAMSENAGTLTGEGLAKAIDEIRTFQTISGKVTFQDDHSAVTSIDVGRIEDGKFIKIKTINPTE